jgi:hypothetical protein
MVDKLEYQMFRHWLIFDQEQEVRAHVYTPHRPLLVFGAIGAALCGAFPHSTTLSFMTKLISASPEQNKEAH